jgi:hypothetical protein
MKKFSASQLPINCPWGEPTEPPRQIRAGIWFVRSEFQFGVALSIQRAMSITKKFPGFEPESYQWWSDDGDMAVAVAAFPKAFADRDCFWAYHKILSNALWEKRFLGVANLCQQAEVHQRSIKYAADNKRFFVRSEVLEDDGDAATLSVVRPADGHRVVIRVSSEWARQNKCYSEAEVSLLMIKPHD